MHVRSGTRNRLTIALGAGLAFAAMAMPAISARGSQNELTPPPSVVPTPVERIATIGASATAGFGAYFWRIEDDRPVRDGTSLAKFLRTASDDTVVVTDLGTGQFFMNPGGIGRMQVDRAIRSKVDLVIGIDFLFWFCYGTVGPDARRMRDADDRMAMLEHGLEILDDVVEAGIPLLVGDIPDMSAARGGILAPSAVPEIQTQLRANERIREWAASHREVEIFSLQRLQILLASDDPIEVDGRTLDPRERTLLLQSDRLHPTLGGLAVIVDAVVDRVREHPLVIDRLPDIQTDYAINLTRLTGFPAMIDQLALDRRQRDIDHTADDANE